jgi:hypothetical protein
LVFPSLSAKEKEEAEAMRKNPFYGAPVLAVSSPSFYPKLFKNNLKF